MNLIDGGKATPSLIDVFMPNDLCARCDELEPADEITLMVGTPDQTARLAFCTETCKESFVRGAEAVKELPDVF